MLSLSEASAELTTNLPNALIQAAILYRGEYVFAAYRSLDRGGMFDSFYAVHANSGKFREFSVLTDGDTLEIMTAFKSSNLITPNNQ